MLLSVDLDCDNESTGNLFSNDSFCCFQYVDHIKFCSKFRTPCRFHVVGCDMSVSTPHFFCFMLMAILS